MQFITTLVGANFRPAETRNLIKTLEPGAALRLDREPDNKYDANAIRVMYDHPELDEAIHLGYIPASENFQLAMLLDVAEGDTDARDAAMGAELIAEGHTPEVERCEILDFVNGLIKPTLVIEITTGWELGTLVRSADEDGDGEEEWLDGEDRLMAEPNLPILELWYQALREPIGIAVQCNDAERMKSALYRARKNADDPALAALMIQTSPRHRTTEVWITHRHVDIDPSELKNVQGQ